MKYFFQIHEQGKNWDDIPAIDLEFDTRVLAVTYAKELAKQKQNEVRMTDNYRLLQGSYFSPSHPQS